MTGLAVLGAVGAQAALQAEAQTAQTLGARRAEVEALRRFAETTHPRGREAAADADWRARWDSLAAEASTLADGAYFVRTRRALGWFKDGHTTVLPFEFTGGVPAPLASGAFGLSLPLRARVFHDGAYVVEAKDEAAPLLGAQLSRVGALDPGALIRAWATDWPGNEAWAHRWAGLMFGSPAFLHALGAVSDPSAAIPMQAVIGRRRVRASLRPRAGAAEGRRELARTPYAREGWASQGGAGNYARLLADRGALYISLDEMDDLDGKSFEAFTRECFAAMAAGAERLVLDLRRNGGGDNYKPEALRKEIARSRFNRPGGLYVLISPYTFSAAQNLTTRLERETFALFVGEPSGGRPNHYGDASVFTGEASGVAAIVSTLPWFDSYPQDQRVWVIPDLPAPSVFADWRDGRDTALEIALAHRIDAPAEELSRDRVFFFRRPSQSADWRPFWRAA